MIAIAGLLSWHWAANKAEPERRVHATANCSARRRERWLNLGFVRQRRSTDGIV